tara:strand:+ start:2289 stop:2762 length:474 start_codon:yes stop_codon:yes gene_type:complete
MNKNLKQIADRLGNNEIPRGKKEIVSEMEDFLILEGQNFYECFQKLEEEGITPKLFEPNSRRQNFRFSGYGLVSFAALQNIQSAFDSNDPKKHTIPGIVSRKNVAWGIHGGYLVGVNLGEMKEGWVVSYGDGNRGFNFNLLYDLVNRVEEKYRAEEK